MRLYNHILAAYTIALAAVPAMAGSGNDATDMTADRDSNAAEVTVPDRKDNQQRKAEGSSLTIGACHYGLNVDSNGISEYYETDSSRPPRVSGSVGIASLDFGFNILTDAGYYGLWEGRGDFLDMNGWKSIRVAWEPASVSVALDRKAHVSLVAGIRILADNFTFSRPYTLVTNDAGAAVPLEIDGYVKKSKLTATYIGLPVRLSFLVGNSLHITGYASGDLLLGGHTKYKKPKVKGTVTCFSPWRISVGGSITYSNLGVYCEYSATPLFEAGTGSDTRTISVGFRFGI